MRWAILTLTTLMPPITVAQESRPKSSEVDGAIKRGLDFLAKDTVAWKKEHNCASCHHAALVVLALREAKDRGHTIDEPVLADMTKWMAESGDGKFGLKRPASAPNAASPKAIYFALALGSDSKRDETSQKGLKLLLKTVLSEQTENGSWSAWPETRPPIFGDSDETLTTLATLALLPVAAAGDADAKTARDKAVKWLEATSKIDLAPESKGAGTLLKPSDDDPQSIALRVVLWKKLDRPEKEWRVLMQKIKERQNKDGGWSQSKQMESDAWATGQALYALAISGVNADDEAITRGQAFLVKTQRDDGSWPMKSRPTKPGGKGSTSLIPITGAGSAWATLGLVRSR